MPLSVVNLIALLPGHYRLKMFLLQIKLALRHLYRNRAFALINLVGLSLGLAAFIYVLILIRHETRFDHFIPGKDRIYRVTNKLVNNDKRMTSGFCNAPAGPEISNEIPGVEEYCRVSAEISQKLTSGTDLLTTTRFRYADSGFFSFFGFKLIEGSAAEVLNQPGSVVLTRAEAIRIFASKDPMGQVLRSPEGLEFVVTGIAENPPGNTHLVFDAIASYNSLESRQGIYLEWDGGWTFLTYLRLKPNIDPENLTQLFPAFLEEKINKKYRQAGWELSLDLQPITDVHMNSRLDYDCSTNRSWTDLLVIISVAVLILILAVINYVNLATSIAFTRIRETGMRKIMGALPGHIRLQLLAESMVLSLMAGAISIVLLACFYQTINQLTRSGFTLSEYSGFVVLASGLAVFLTGTVAGMGPAWFLGRQQALAGVQQALIGRQRQYLRNGLVAFQFFTAVVLIGMLILIEKQGRFVKTIDVGFDRNNIGSINVARGLTNYETGRIRDELKKIPEISEVCLTSEIPGAGVTANGYRLEGIENIELVRTIYTDEHFLACFGIHLKSGRNFRSNSGSDASGFIVNQALADLAHWSDPLGKKIERNRTFEVIGSVDNFHFASLYEPVAPLIISVNPASDSWSYYFVNIRFNSSDIAGLVNKIRMTWENNLPGELFEFQFLDDYLASSYKSLDENRKMISLFSGLAILIAAIGLFGLSAFVTYSRRKEIGIRKVNGATTGQIIILLNYRMIRWVIAGFVAACPVSVYLMSRWLQSFAYKTAISWWIFALAGTIAIVIAALTVTLESGRTAGMNPAETLRQE